MLERESPPTFAVLDPRLERNREIIAALGTDAFEIEVGKTPESDLVCRVKLSALGSARVIRVCRMLARRHGMTFDRAVFEAVQGRGISICAHCCYVCDDPAIGREFFRDWDRAGGS